MVCPSPGLHAHPHGTDPHLRGPATHPRPPERKRKRKPQKRHRFLLSRGHSRQLRRSPLHFSLKTARPRLLPINPPAQSHSPVSHRALFLPCPSPRRSSVRPFHPIPNPLAAASLPGAPCEGPPVPRPGCWIDGRHEGRAEAGPARRQTEAEGAQGRLHSPRYRPGRRGHQGRQDDGGRHRRPHPRRRQAAQQALPHGADPLRRPGQGGEEGRRRQEGRRQEGAIPGVPAVVRAAAAVPLPPAPVLLRPQRRGRPQLLRHLLIELYIS